jgi:hypothetical protein
VHLPHPDGREAEVIAKAILAHFEFIEGIKPGRNLPFFSRGAGSIKEPIGNPPQSPFKRGGLKTPVAHLKIVKKAFLQLQRGF